MDQVSGTDAQPPTFMSGVAQRLRGEEGVDVALTAILEEHILVDAAAPERGRRYVPSLFAGLDLPAELDQVVLLQFGGSARETVGGARLIWVADFIAEMLSTLRARRPDKAAIPSTLPLLRTLQLAAHFSAPRGRNGKLVQEPQQSEAAGA